MREAYERLFGSLMAMTTPVVRMKRLGEVSRDPVRGRKYWFCGGTETIHTVKCHGDGWSAFAPIKVKGNELWVSLLTQVGEENLFCQLRLFHPDVVRIVDRGPGHCVNYHWRYLAVNGRPSLGFDGEELLIFDRRMTKDAIRGRALRIPVRYWESFFEDGNLSDRLEGWEIGKFKGQ